MEQARGAVELNNFIAVILISPVTTFMTLIYTYNKYVTNTGHFCPKKWGVLLNY